ncbi:MAG TPA: carbamoyl-phosphate synthase domain-containing protein, partial [Nitrospiria bacterium]|nr:carbamoyl-phosphate synthase domain-containing protein [Nitrospiria bacterium]
MNRQTESGIPPKAVLALADGRVFHGFRLGAEGQTAGEVVFNTSMTGYQEILTDPSYRGQLVTMTYPLIGSTGVNTEDVESRQPFLSGFIVRDYIDHPSNWRSAGSLGEYLEQNGIVGIQGIDTRALTKHIRDAGAQQGVISSSVLDEEALIEKARKTPPLIGRDLVSEVTCPSP